MLIYLLIYLPFILCAYFDFVKTPQKLKNDILWVWVVVFTLFRGLRWETGTDWDQYYLVYQNAEWNNIFSYYRYANSMEVMDYGYMFINTIFHKAGLSYTWFLLATNFWIMWALKDFCIRHTKYPIITMVLFLNIGVPFPVRQTISMATAMWGLRFALERRALCFFTTAIAAALIHKGSIIVFPLYFLPFLTNKKVIKWYVFFIVYMSTYIFAALWGEYIREFITLTGTINNEVETVATSYLEKETTATANVQQGYNVSLMNGLSYTCFFLIFLFIREKHHLLCVKKITSFEFFFFCYSFVATIDNLIRESDKTGMTEILGRTAKTIDTFPLLFPLLIIYAIKITHIFNKEWAFIVFFVYMLYKYWQQIPGSFYASLFIPYKSVLI